MLTADYLDIIFDNRNKAYGGYELRKNYNRRVKKGVGFLMLGLASIASFSFIHADKPKNNVVPPIIIPVDIKNIDTKHDIPKPPKPDMPPPPPPAQAITKRFADLQVMRDDQVKPDDMPPAVTTITNSGPRNNDSGSIEAPPISGPTGSGTTAVVTTPPPPPIRDFVEQMPAFNGDILAFIAKNINYPEAAREAGVQGRVGVEFVVNEDGSITDVRVARGIGAGCDEEAVRVIKAMPKWKPGKQNGVPVKVRFTQPISFRLN